MTAGHDRLHTTDTNRGSSKPECTGTPFWGLKTGNLSLEHFDCKIIGFHSWNLRYWAQQVSNFCHSNLIVNESFKFHIFYDHKFTMLIAFTTKLKKKQHEITLNTFSRSLII